MSIHPLLDERSNEDWINQHDASLGVTYHAEHASEPALPALHVERRPSHRFGNAWREDWFAPISVETYCGCFPWIDGWNHFIGSNCIGITLVSRPVGDTAYASKVYRIPDGRLLPKFLSVLLGGKTRET